MGIVLVTDMRIREFAVEGFLCVCVGGGEEEGEFGLSEAISGVHILVGVNTLPQ